MNYRIEPAATVYRGDFAEAVHYASVAVVNRKGELTHYLGNPMGIFMTRSSIKPFQLMPLILSGAADSFGFSPEQLSIMCGSHTGTDKHRTVVISNLELAGNLPGHLKCGCHVPLWMQIEKVFPSNGEEKDPVRHNCSGKHSGFLALSKHLDVNPNDYLNPESSTQEMIKENLSRYCEYNLDKISYAVDGCSAPNYPLPLINLALGFKKLANGEGENKEIIKAVKRIKDAMISYPFMVSGEKRFDYDLKCSFPGNVVCKIGAESTEGIGFSDTTLGIAVKIHDGNSRCLGPVCIEVLKQLGIIKDIKDFPYLKKYETPEIRNVSNIVTGKIAVNFTLKKI
ncbi:MAG: asparaginase [Candidatus Zixiibacteriota bacterium]